MHPRTRSQGYSGKADWNIIKEVKEAVNIPVIGNGDILSAKDAKKMIDEKINSGEAYNKFVEWIEYQNGDINNISISDKDGGKNAIM